MSSDFWGSIEGTRSTEQASPAMPVMPVGDQPSTAKSTSLPEEKPKSKAKAKETAAPDLVQEVTESASKMQQKAPAVTTPDPIEAMYDTLLKNWGIPAAVGLYGVYQIGKRMIGKDAVSSPANRTEPQMSGRTADAFGRVEPTFNEPVSVPDRSAATPNVGMSDGERFYGVKARDAAERQILDRSAEAARAKQLAPGAVPPPAPGPMATSPVAPVAPAAMPPEMAPMAPAAPTAAPEAPTAAPKAKKAPVQGIAPPEGLTSAQKSAFNYIVKSQRELGIKNPADYVEFVKQVFAGQPPEMGPKGGAPAGYSQQMGEFKQTQMLPLSKPERDALRARGVDIPSSQKGGATVPGMLNVLGNTIGAIGLVDAYKRGKQTGDYSDFFLNLATQGVANIAPRAGLGMGLMSPGGLNTNEAAELARRRGMAPTID